MTTDNHLKAAPLWARLVSTLTRHMPGARYRFIEWLCRGSNQRFAGRMARELGGYSFDCSLRDMIARQVYFAGCYSAQELAYLRAALKPGMCLVDVGANWGLFTLAGAHRVGEAGQVVALEPDPRILVKLSANVARNHLRQVQVFDVAVADRDSSMTLVAHDHEAENWGLSRLVEAGATAQPSFLVRTRRLDSLLDEAGIGRVDLLKIDVEGVEDLVVSGMEKGLGEHRYRRIVLELHSQQLAERRRAVDQVIAPLRLRGYKGYAFDYSPAGVRRAYYHPWQHFARFLRPLEEGLATPAPHTLWLTPDQVDLP